MSQAAVNISNVSSTTSEKELHDFFSFCGKINSIEFKDNEGESKTAVIAFDKHTAAHTALMLNGSHLGGNTISVTSDVEHADHPQEVHDVKERPHIEQSDKPRAGIAAEYLAKGYTLGDQVLQRAIDIDNKQGISKNFLSYISGLDKSIGKSALGPDQTISGKVQSTLAETQSRAKTMDEHGGYSKTAHEYYTKALTSPFGQAVLSFYTDTSKQVRDIHEEAVRIKGHKSPAPTSPPAPEPASSPSTQQPEPPK